MQNNFDLKEIEKLKELGDILKIKFIPDLYKVYTIETLFDKFFVHKDDLGEYTDELQKEFDELFVTLYGVYALDKKEYFNLMETLKVRMELADDVFKKLRREATLIFNRTEKKTVANNGEVYFQIWRSEQRQKFLSKVYNLEELGKQFKMLVEITYDKGVIEFLKKENHNLKSLRNIFCLIYNEREWHYRLLEEMLLYKLRVSSDKIEYFEKVIVKNIGEKFNSPSLVASGSDATFDAILSSSVLVSAILYIFTDINIEAYVGVLISIFIIKSGIEIFMDAVNEILGKRVDKKTINKIKKTICKIENVYGAYDLMLHNYGPDKYVGSVHIEIPDSMTAEDIDPLERKITNIVLEKHNIYLTGITVYSMNTKNMDIVKLRYKIYKIVMSNDGVLEFHGFYLEEKNKSIRFDIIIDYKIEDMDELYNIICEDVKNRYPDYKIDVLLDFDMSD